MAEDLKYSNLLNMIIGDGMGSSKKSRNVIDELKRVGQLSDADDEMLYAPDYEKGGKVPISNGAQRSVKTYMYGGKVKKK